MKPKISEICEEALKRVTPTPQERKGVMRLVKNIQERVKEASEKVGLKAEIKIEGSIAKDTWLRNEADIDVFMLVPTSLRRENLGETCLRVAKEAVKGYRWIERFAEHPYLEANVEGARVNIVPCYKVERGEWISAVDRTPFHTEYIREKISSEEAKNEVRLLKKFMKGVGVYSAEIKIGGFSGYLCELLVLEYHKFHEILKAVTLWKSGVVVDIESYYRSRHDEVRRIFEAPLIVVDPVDKNRNAAAAVSRDRFEEFTAASRAFLESPRLTFFYPPETIPLTITELEKKLQTRGTDLIFLKFKGVEAVPDILWGQLYKTSRSIRKLLKQYDFNVIRASTWSDERSVNVFLFELETKVIPPTKKHMGPPVDSREGKAFLKKHVGAEHTVCGPWIENGRWFIEIKRKYRDAFELLQDKLKDGGRRVGVASKLVKGFEKTLNVLSHKDIVEFYRQNANFAKFLTEYLIGKPIWLSPDLYQREGRNV